MAATNKWTTLGSVVNLLTTQLNSIATAKVSAASAEWDNATGLHLYAVLDLNLAALSPTAGAYAVIWGWLSADGTNFGGLIPATGSAASGSDPAIKFSASLDTTASGTPRIVTPPILVAPGKYKFQVENVSGVTLAASGNTLDLYPFNINNNA